MIGSIRGTLIDKQPPWLTIEAHGVGYEIEAPLSTIFQLGGVGSEVRLHTHLVVREDAQLLYGFHSAAERQLFRDLIRASGVGPKLALAILSGLGADDFWRAVRDSDSATLVKLPGIGRKTAERLVVEMRDKATAAGQSLDAPGAVAAAGGPQDEARAALQSLGYKPAEAERLIRAVWQEDMAADTLLRAALKQAVR